MSPLDQVRIAALVLSVADKSPLPDGWTLTDRLFSNLDPNPFGVVCLDDASGDICVALRGTETPIEWFKDAQFAFVNSPFGPGKTEDGFTAVYQSLKTESGKSPGPIKRIAGHSLGGPLATYLGLLSQTATEEAAEILLIESPSPGDAPFVAWASSRFASITRWENPHDVVPDLPGRILGYRDLISPVTTIDVSALGVSWFDLEGNHSLANCIKAFCRSNAIK